MQVWDNLCADNMIRGLLVKQAHEHQVICAQITFSRITCHKELMNVGITAVCDNISLRITSYSDDMNI
jgi:hypothetical protein